MLRIKIICIGKIKERYFTDAIAEYQKRLSAFCKFTITELPEERLRGDSQAQKQAVIDAEGRRILQKIDGGDYVVALCIEGEMLTSEQLSKKLEELSNSGRSTVDFIIGGSLGLSDEVKRRADFSLSMSRMTFPHQMARVILSEQIYRAFEISTNGKYHK